MLTQITIKVRLEPRAGAPIADAQVAGVRDSVHAGVDKFWNTGKNRLPNGDHVRVNVEFVGAGEAAHLTVDLQPGKGRADQTHWFLEDLGTVQAHELGHQLGLLDEYIDAKTVNRGNASAPGVTNDKSLMGNFWAGEGVVTAGTEVKQRHWDQIGGDITGARDAKAAAGAGAPGPAPHGPEEGIGPWTPETDGPAAQAPGAKGSADGDVHQVMAEEMSRGGGSSVGEDHGLSIVDGEPTERPALDLESARQKLEELRRRPGMSAEARELAAVLESAAKGGDPELLEVILSSFGDEMAGRRPLVRDRPTIPADLTDPQVLEAFVHSMTFETLEGHAAWDRYREIILLEHQARGSVEVGGSPRSSDGDNVPGTDHMRSELIAAIKPDGPITDPLAFIDGMQAGNGAIPEAVEMVRDHLRNVVEAAGSAEAAVANGDAVWIDALTGARTTAGAPNAVLWPADPVWGVWQVDHAVELQHGGDNGVSNYGPAPAVVHKAKSLAMNRFGRRVAALSRGG